MQENRAWNRLKDEELIETLKLMEASEIYPAKAQKVYEALKDKYDAKDLPSVRTVGRSLRNLLGKSDEELDEITDENGIGIIDKGKYNLGFKKVNKKGTYITGYELEIYTEAEINLEGNIGVSYELTAETTQGFNYNSKTGKVEEINQVTCESDGLQWNTISISGDTSMGSSVHLITKLYDASGMDMSLKIAGKAEGEAKVTTNKELDGYAGSLDLSIVPEIKGEIVVDTPVFDKNLLKQPLFEAALKPLWEKHWESSVNWQDDLQWKENDKNEESQETTKVSYSNEYFEVIVPESWEGEWTVTEEDNTMNGIKSTLYRFSHDPADGEEGGAADVYVLDMSDTSIPLSHYSRMLPSAGCEEVGLTSFGYNDVFKMEVANGFFYENGATITLK